MRRLALACLLLAGPARAACTQEQAAAKGAEVSRVVQAREAADPAKTRGLMQQLQSIGQAKQQRGGFPDWTKVCAAYDAMLSSAR